MNNLPLVFLNFCQSMHNLHTPWFVLLQIIEVKEGRICATGSLDDVIKADPETYSSWAEAIKEDEEPESEEVKDVEEERKSLKRQLSKKDSFVKQMSKGMCVIICS